MNIQEKQGKIMIRSGLALALIPVFLSGCFETAAVKTAAAEIEQTAIVANDLQLKYSKKGMCSSSFSAVMRAYDGHPKELRAFMVLCGVDEEVIDLILESM